MLTNKYKTWLEVSRENLLHNISQVRKIISDQKIGAVIKANAYGHGIKEVAQIIDKKIDWFCVDNIDEALFLRKIGIAKPILIMGYIPNPLLKNAIDKNISFVFYNKEVIQVINQLNLKKKAKIHLKIETGLNRQGLNGRELVKLLWEIRKFKDRIRIEGVYTHFANIEDTLDPSFAKVQIERFTKEIDLLAKENVVPDIIHCAASAAILLYPKTHFSMVRFGIAMYGLWPSKETKIALSLAKRKIKLVPVLSWRSVVAQVKYVNVGESVGYGRTWFAARKSKVAVIPIGYSDGFDRKLSNSGRVLVRGRFANVIGRVAMNMIMIDVTDIYGVKPGDTVTIIGKDGKNTLPVEEIADKLGTINYEVISRINPAIPRIVL